MTLPRVVLMAQAVFTVLFAVAFHLVCDAVRIWRSPEYQREARWLRERRRIRNAALRGDREK
jgi:uncharacterized membrane-anchored protein